MWRKKNLDFDILKYGQVSSQKDHENCFGSVKELGKILGNIFIGWILSAGIGKVRTICVFALQLLRNDHTETGKWQPAN